MLRLLVADDERLEREALQFVAQQLTDLDTEVILAANGQEAVEQATRHRPDIAFLDIKMPVMDGIEAAKQIKHHVPGVRIVFLTAFNHFDYAQEAIRLHADDYILKPADNERIVQVIRSFASATGRLDHMARESDTTELAEAKLITDAVLGNANEQMLRRFLQIEESGPILTMALVIRVSAKCYPPNMAEARYDRLIRRRVLAALRLEAQADGFSVLGSTEQSVLYVLFATTGDRSIASTSLSMEQVIGAALVRAYEEFGMDAVAGIDRLETGFERLGLRFANAKIASRSADASNPDPARRRTTGRVFRYQAAEQADQELRRTLLESERELLRAIVGNHAERAAATDSFVAALQRLSPSLDMLRRESVQSLAYLVHATSMYVGSLPARTVSLDFVGLAASTVEVVLAVRQAIERLADHVRTSAESTHRAVTAARQLIDTRYAEDLSLERISENVHVSPFHLARIFKTATGTTVMDYVTLVRMDKAKDLMRNPRLSLKEISSLVGYRDQNYFSRVFRRLNGTTPTSFRRAWQ